MVGVEVAVAVNGSPDVDSGIVAIVGR